MSRWFNAAKYESLSKSGSGKSNSSRDVADDITHDVVESQIVAETSEIIEGKEIQPNQYILIDGNYELIERVVPNRDYDGNITSIIAYHKGDVVGFETDTYTVFQSDERVIRRSS